MSDDSGETILSYRSHILSREENKHINIMDLGQTDKSVGVCERSFSSFVCTSLTLTYRLCMHRVYKAKPNDFLFFQTRDNIERSMNSGCVAD